MYLELKFAFAESKSFPTQMPIPTGPVGQHKLMLFYVLGAFSIQRPGSMEELFMVTLLCAE